MIGRYEYPCVLTPAPDCGYVILFPDIPEAISQADSVEEAGEIAVDALVAALSFYVESDAPLPAPSLIAEEQLSVSVPPIAAAKLGLYETLREQGLCRAELARRIGGDEDLIRRLLNLDRRCDIDRVNHALSTLGRRIVISVQPLL